jgi:murein DD-endopeptidase MepM/ murein hydrolase activator NlpD
MKYLVGLVLLLLVAAAGAYVVAGRQPGPSIKIQSPEKFVGVSTALEVVVSAPGAQLSSLDVTLEQNGKQLPLYSQEDPKGTQVKQDGPDRVRLMRNIGRQGVPELQSGAAKIVVRASRPVLYNIRRVQSTETRDVQVRLERPRVSVISTHHYVNLGGAEMVVYRATPPDVQSGVVVGDVEYPGYPASGAGVPGVNITDPAVKIAFFALRYDQDVNTPMRLFARDEAGNTARADFDFRTFPKPFKNSKIMLDDKFIERVVPAILEGTTEIRPEGTTIEKFVAINSELRRKNAEKIASFASESAPQILWGGQVFHPFTNTGVQSAFADRRTYMYQGKEVDRQVHLGFDLASFAGTPIVASNAGKVLFADELGIYGNCVILDHGMGVQSLYAHLSSIEVKVGDTVTKEQQLGRSGMTGMAGGDHLHFTMLVNGQMVNPVEWWDPHWIEDRLMRKLRAAGGTAAATGTDGR